MYNILLVPVNDLISHPISTRFIPLADRLTEKHGVKISMLRYCNIPTASKFLERTLDVEPIMFKSVRSKNIGSYYLFNSSRMFSSLLRFMKTNTPDAIIHANILPSTIAACLGKLFNVPIIFDYQDSFPDSAAAYFKSRTLSSFVFSTATMLTRFNIQASDAIVVVTDHLKHMIKKHDKNKPVEVIPNGVDTDLFRPMPRTKAFNTLNIETLSKKVVMLYFGSIDPWVDFITPLKVVRRLSKIGVDVLFFVIGVSHSGWYLNQVKRSAKSIGVEDRLYLFDPVPQEQLIYYINAADIVLAPYKPIRRNYGAHLKILESLACGKDVVVTRIPETQDRFKGVVYTYQSERELESVILKIIRGETNIPITEKRKIAEKYSWDSLASRYYELIKHVVSIRR